MKELSSVTFSVKTIQCKLVGWLMNDELEKIWKEVIMAFT
jgi:hypothetical protein